MKASSLALLALLLVAVWTGSQGMSFRSLYDKCCYKGMFVKKKIPAIYIKGHQKTPSHCSHKAFLVELRKGNKVCVAPEERWFQEYQWQKGSTITSK
ncbi:PREDICTED: C-C motif chemokine 5-like [Mesitornis unicolor]|uniref:C-C motif chemokine 5-like n=1 Tax=Mesitornis unicolor TaxID=54374 RepID=UPI000528AA56|nr:PREDICTED: C-C motif chemokine 5-like [Mesitornis unicolor]